MASLSAVENWNSGRLYPPTADNNMKLETEERFKRGEKKKSMYLRSSICVTNVLTGRGKHRGGMVVLSQAVSVPSAG